MILNNWLLLHGHKPRLKQLAIGARVKGLPGGVSESWTGIIVGNEPFKDGRDYWQVRWFDREFGKFPDKSINRNPTIGSLSEHLLLVAQ
jgi:hypothetical protein